MRRELAREHPTEFLSAFRCLYSLQVRFSDLDRLGHVNNSVHQQFFDLGRLHYFEDLLSPRPNWDAAIVIIAHLSIDFLQPIFLESRVAVFTRVLPDIGEKSFIMEQAIATPDRTQIHTIAESVMVGYHARELHSIPLLPSWVEQIKRYEQK
jgi:thioesterase